MSRAITIIDYGMGNLFSVARAFEKCGAKIEWATRPEHVLTAERLVLPGVGAFRDGMAELRKNHLDSAIRDYVPKGRPLLGICLGMQMLFDASEEFGRHEGLGLLPGDVLAVPGVGSDGAPHKVPHIGWNSLHAPEGANWKGTILDDVRPKSSVYFVHSFTPVPKESSHRLADSDYDGCRISAVVRREQVYGCQFHPEKSGSVGLRIVAKFLKA